MMIGSLLALYVTPMPTGVTAQDINARVVRRNLGLHLSKSFLAGITYPHLCTASEKTYTCRIQSVDTTTAQRLTR